MKSKVKRGKNVNKTDCTNSRDLYFTFRGKSKKIQAVGNSKRSCSIEDYYNAVYKDASR